MKTKSDVKDEKNLTFFGHLKELRKRLLLLLIVFAVLFCIFLYRADDIINLVTGLGKTAGYKLVYISPEEVMVQQLRTAGIAALLVLFPLCVYEIAVFVAPAVNSGKAFRNVLLFFITGTVMFIVGALFAYKIMLPFSLKYFNDIAVGINIQSQVSLEKYLNFIIAMVLAIGISFDFPVVCFLLSAVGIVNSKILKKARPGVIVGIFIVAAIITPPDVMTQFMVAIPLCALFEISILVIKMVEKTKNPQNQKGVKNV